MTLTHTRIEDARLSEAARKVLGPGPAKLMAARGLAPLSRPADLVTVLYQLRLDDDAGVRKAAEKSAAELPAKVLGGALGDPALDSRVLDFFATAVKGDESLTELVILNPATADATIATMARGGSAREVDLIATNEERLLRHPEIVGAMYVNPRARMSTVDRAVELAVRNQVRVPGIAAWEEVSAAVLGQKRNPEAAQASDAADQLFARAARAVTDKAEGPPEEQDEASGKDLPISEMSVPAKIRLATLGNAFARSVLIRDSIKMVAMAAIKAPGVKDSEALKYASNHSLSEDVIGYIANRREWTKQYAMKLALVQNPKTAIAAAIRLMPHLRERDLRTISKSKGVATAVAANARKMVMNRGKTGAKK